MDDKRISRRELLRTIGLVGAATWAAPVLSGRQASASIDRCTRKGSRKLCRGIPDGNCTNGYEQCGTCNSDVGGGSFCFQEMTSGSTMYCAEDVFCSEAGRCMRNRDCRAQGLGNSCITRNGCTGCGPFYGVCSTRCCTGLAPPRSRVKPRRLGKTASGR
jgi:hypothetical protein